jgi:alpha-mannosidase
VGVSELSQVVRLGAGSPRLDFETEAEWRETRKMLRVVFPVNVRADRSTCEIQFGTYRRPTHDNTSWERAQFEVCAHRFADLSEVTHGVALLNDCKYGHFLKGNLLDLNLLRSPVHPDPEADQGHHRFTYALFPHEGDFADGGVVAEAHRLNQPPVVLNDAVELDLPVKLEAEGVVVETLKKAENKNALVVRLYEALGRREDCVLHADEAAELWETNLMEERTARIGMDANRAELSFHPFEIKTVLVVS